MNFEEYLVGKKIDAAQFNKNDPEQYQELQLLFDRVHPNSFTQQKLFLINTIRRRYQLPLTMEPKKTTAKSVKPKIKPLKPKTS